MYSISPETARQVFMNGVDRQIERFTASNEDRIPEVVVRDPDGALHLVRREEFFEDENGLTVANEFMLSWDGIRSVISAEEALRADMTDGRYVEVEAAP